MRLLLTATDEDNILFQISASEVLKSSHIGLKADEASAPIGLSKALLTGRLCGKDIDCIREFNMFRKAKKDYLELSVRVSAEEFSYDINITSKDENLPEGGDGFHLVVSGSDDAGEILRTALRRTRTITEDEREYLPCKVAYDDIAESPWNEFPIGITEDLNIATWNPLTSPNLLIFGPPGSGKSVIDRNLMFHCLQHPDKWRVLGIDLGPWEIASFSKYTPVVEHIAKDMEAALEVCRAVRDEMMDRYEKMESLGINNYRDLPDAPTAIMFLISEVSALFGWWGGDMPSGISKDALKEEFSMILTKISRLGRAAGVHLVLSSWQADSSVIGDELKENMTTKVVLGRIYRDQSLLLLGNEEASHITVTSVEDRDGEYHLASIRGRGYIQKNEEGKHFQAAFAPEDWYDERLKNNQSVND